jgi:hypothetical protein
MMTNPNQIQIPTLPASFGTFQSKAITNYDQEVIEVTGRKKSQYVRPLWFPSRSEAERYLQTLTSGTIWKSKATFQNGYVITGKREFMTCK